MDRDFLSEFLDLNGDGHVTPEEARIGLSFLETALHREPELWDEDGFDENAADDDGEYGFGGYLLDDDDGGFEGFDEGHELTPILEDLLAKADPDYASKPDIKWNFTKFLVDRAGNVVRRFEPTASTPDVVSPAVEELL